MPTEPLEPRFPEDITRRLNEIIWHYNFMRYFWMKTNAATPAPILS